MAAPYAAIHRHSAPSLPPLVTAHVEPGATVITDAWQGHSGIDRLGYTHDRRSQQAARTRGRFTTTPRRSCAPLQTSSDATSKRQGRWRRRPPTSGSPRASPTTQPTSSPRSSTRQSAVTRATNAPGLPSSTGRDTRSTASSQRPKAARSRSPSSATSSKSSSTPGKQPGRSSPKAAGRPGGRGLGRRQRARGAEGSGIDGRYLDLAQGHPFRARTARSRASGSLRGLLAREARLPRRPADARGRLADRDRG